MQNLSSLPLSEIQSFRQLAALLHIQARLEIAEGQYDKALHTIQTGLALSRHICDGNTMIHNLVGVAIASVMLGVVEELIQQPDAPNLYWALTDLPRPFCDVRRTTRYEMGTLYRSFPQFRELERGDLSAEQAQKLMEDFTQTFCKIAGNDAPAGLEKVGMALTVASLYPEAKRQLIAHG